MAGMVCQPRGLSTVPTFTSVEVDVQYRRAFL